MSHRLTKEELDEQFELFLKESVSDDSLDLGSSDKKPSTKSSRKSAKKPSVSLWEDDEHSGQGTGRAETTKSRFIKVKKPQPSDSNVVSAEPFYKPVPKPRTEALDKQPQLDDAFNVTVLNVSQSVKRSRTPSDDSHSDSLSSRSHENLQCLSREESPDGTNSQDTSPTSINSYYQGDSDDGLLGSGKTLKKSFRKSQSILEEEEDPGGTSLKDDELEATDLSRKRTGTEVNIGLDTLEEEEEKAVFFAQLEKRALSTIDYSKLNREPDSTSSTIDTDNRKAEGAAEQSDDDQRKAKVTETIRESPAFTGSPHYSEDFEEEENGKEPLEEKSKMSPILAKVSLYDSLDDTGEDDGRKKPAGSLDIGQSYVQSGGSEMEALQEAYRQIQVVEDSDDHNLHYSSQEDRERSCRPVSPSSPPKLSKQSLQPAYTDESELPTAEELMKPIRPENDHIRGFTLQPVRTLPDMSSPESQLKRKRQAYPDAGRGGARGLSSPDPPDHNLTWSIRQEVERLMQDQDKYSSHTSSQTGKANKKLTPHGSTISHTSPSLVRKPAATHLKTRPVEGRAALTMRSSGPSRAAVTARTRSSVSHPLQQPQKKTKFTKSSEEFLDASLKVRGELVASVQSLVAVLQQQIDTGNHQDAADIQEAKLTHCLPKDNEEEESSVVKELRVQLAQKERELQRMKEEAEELNALRKQNYLLQSKLQSAEEASQEKRWAKVSDSSTEKKLQQMEKEIQEQEMLIKGYQQENEKLYLQMKAQQVKSKADEESMFNENQRLLNELAFTREQLNNRSRPVGNVCFLDHTQRITDLLAQINTFQRKEAKLLEDSHILKQEKQALEVELQLMKKERDLAKAQAVSATGDKTCEMRVLVEKHKEEVAALKRKLQWFAENQELLDRDARRLKEATAEIHQLKEQVETLKMDVSRRNSEQHRKAKEKTVETKRMQDLERQVKELEQILRRRNPNSLPALIYAAATANHQDDVDTAKTTPPSRINALLERRIQRLEAELECNDEEAKRSLRAMEQQFHRIKLRYDQQISELEQQLEKANSATGIEPWMSQVRPLQEELQCVKEAHQEKEKSLQDQIETLQQQLKHKAHESPGRHQRQAEAAFGVRIERLNRELSAKTRSIQELNRTVERLQRERRHMLPVPNSRPGTLSKESKQPTGSAKTQCSATAEETREEETFPAAHYEKAYQPTVFADTHISEVLQENEALKQHLELLKLQNEQEKEALKSDAVQAKEQLCRLQEHSAEQLCSMKAEHLRMLDQLRATHALQHSSSKVAELTNKLNTKEIMVKHLEDQLKELQRAKDALAISRTREDALQKQLTRLLKELKEAKEAQSSEVKLICSLEKKILNMELRHQHREKELQQVIGGSWQSLDADQQSEVERWKRLAQDKSRELEAFRLELDSILDILRHLQRQGVVLPLTAPPTSAVNH